MTEVREFLGKLAYGDESRRLRPGIRERYEEKMKSGDLATAAWFKRKET